MANNKEITYSNLKGETTSFTKICSTVGTTEMLSNVSSIDFWVHGQMIDTELNTEFEFEKFFDNQSDAEDYFEKMKSRYPISEVILKSRSFTEIKVYA
jgi:hypothetical protein